MTASLPFTLRATLSDGFEVTLAERFATESEASRAADRYITDYSDPCALGVHVSYVSILDDRLMQEAA